MNDPRTHSPAYPDISIAAIAPDPFWEKNKTAIISTLLGVVILALATASWLAYSASMKADARRMLALADSPEALQALVKTHPRSNPAADALLLLAAEHRAAGDMDASNTAFRDFLQAFPDHQLAGGALLGIGQNQEASGDQANAATTYQQVLTQYPASYAAPFAAYAEAEILLRDFQRTEAVKRYNMIVSQFPRSPVAFMSMQQLRRLGASPNP